MLIAQWILEITDILMNQIVSFWKKSVTLPADEKGSILMRYITTYDR